MSAKYIREKVRQWCNAAAGATGVPFYDTINQNTNPQDDVWFSVQFLAQFHEGNFCDREYMERGLIILIVVAQPGLGDIPCLDAIEAIIPDMMGRQDAKLSLQSYEPIQEETEGSADNRYRLSVDITYVYSK